MLQTGIVLGDKFGIKADISGLHLILNNKNPWKIIFHMEPGVHGNYSSVKL